MGYPTKKYKEICDKLVKTAKELDGLTNNEKAFNEKVEEWAEHNKQLEEEVKSWKK